MTFPCSNNEKKIKHVYCVNSIDSAIIESFSSLSNTSNRFCVAVGLFRSQTQEINKCGKNRSETLSWASCATFFILATF